MIPHIIHYCWFGGNPLPELAERCIASWKKYMPEWEYRCWSEETFEVSSAPLYVRQAYEAKKFAFVSDYVRLWALEQYGGLYMDVDFEVFRPFDDLMDKYPAFAGYEGSKRQPVMQGVIASEPHGAWVRDMLSTYENREFIKAPVGESAVIYDLTPNTSYFTDRLESQGFIPDGLEKDLYAEILPDASIHLSTFHTASADRQNIKPSALYLHLFPVHYFCPVLTTGEDVRTSETYCCHMRLGSWDTRGTWKSRLLSFLSPSIRTKLIILKRKLLG